VPEVTHLSYALAAGLAWWVLHHEALRLGLYRLGSGGRVRTLAGPATLLGGVTCAAAARMGRALEVAGWSGVLAAPLRSWRQAAGSNGLPGLLAALLALGLLGRSLGYRPRRCLDAAAPGLALAQVAGRLGCLLAGHCYGLPTDLPWGVRDPLGHFPHNRVHPTPAYEAAAALLTFLLLWKHRHQAREGQVAGLLLWMLGLERLAVEVLRRNPQGLLGLTQAQVLAVGMVVVGVLLVLVPHMPRGHPVEHGTGQRRA